MIHRFFISPHEQVLSEVHLIAVIRELETLKKTNLTGFYALFKRAEGKPNLLDSPEARTKADPSNVFMDKEGRIYEGVLYALQQLAMLGSLHSYFFKKPAEPLKCLLPYIGTYQATSASAHFPRIQIFLKKGQLILYDGEEQIPLSLAADSHQALNANHPSWPAVIQFSSASPPSSLVFLGEPYHKCARNPSIKSTPLSSSPPTRNIR